MHSFSHRSTFPVLAWVLCALLGLIAGPEFCLAKRGAPADVQPVVAGNVEYSAPHDAMGFVVASDAKTHQELWRARIYAVKYQPGLETDVQDVFITSLQLEGGSLIVTNEKKERFSLDLSTRKATKSK